MVWARHSSYLIVILQVVFGRLETRPGAVRKRQGREEKKKICLGEGAEASNKESCLFCTWMGVIHVRGPCYSCFPPSSHSLPWQLLFQRGKGSVIILHMWRSTHRSLTASQRECECVLRSLLSKEILPLQIMSINSQASPQWCAPVCKTQWESLGRGMG